MLFQALLTFNEHGFSDEVEKKVLPSLSFLGKCELCCNVSSSLEPLSALLSWKLLYSAQKNNSLKCSQRGVRRDTKCFVSVPTFSASKFKDKFLLCFLVHRVLYSSLANKTIMRRVFDMGKYGPMSMTTC